MYMYDCFKEVRKQREPLQENNYNYNGRSFKAEKNAK